MKYARKVSEIINAFSPAPLQGNQMEEFYCKDTMEFRTSDKYDSPIEDINDACRESQECMAFLLLGHRGCGKSTELNRMSERLAGDGYYVRTINCSMDLDLVNMLHSDLFILMGEALVKMAEESGCGLGQDMVAEMEDFWCEGTEITVSQEVEAASLEAGMSAGTGIFTNLFNIFAKIKTDLKYNEECRKEYRKKIHTRSGEWIKILGNISGEIARENDGKRPIIIFEDLDKLNPEVAWKVFYNYAALLSGMKFPVIYTFPISLSYDARFSAMESYFVTKTLPMIKIQTIEGEDFQDGIDMIEQIVEKRANLRDLFMVINASAKRAVRRESQTVSMEDAGRALEELKTSLTRRIEKKNYDFLENIYRGNKEQIEDKEMLLEMLQASVVLEYNGKRWHNVHPLVVEFLKGQG